MFKTEIYEQKEKIDENIKMYTLFPDKPRIQKNIELMIC